MFSPTRELDIFFSFTWRDWSTTLIPGVIYSISPLRAILTESRISPWSIIYRYALLLAWLTAFVYSFNLSNQIAGVEEDRINKPDRPIPSGKVTLESAKRRWLATTALFLGFTIVEPMLWSDIARWVAVTAFLSRTRAGNHWVGKNLVGMTLGTWSLLSGIYKCIDPIGPVNMRWTICLASWAGIIFNSQDLRDMLGDKTLGRKTMPIVFGEAASRWIIALVCVPLSMFSLRYGGVDAPAPLLSCVLHVILAYQIIQANNPRKAHKAYMMVTYVFCALLAFESLKGFRFENTVSVVSQWSRTVMSH